MRFLSWIFSHKIRQIIVKKKARVYYSTYFCAKIQLNIFKFFQNNFLIQKWKNDTFYYFGQFSCLKDENPRTLEKCDKYFLVKLPKKLKKKQGVIINLCQKMVSILEKKVLFENIFRYSIPKSKIIFFRCSHCFLEKCWI